MNRKNRENLIFPFFIFLIASFFRIFFLNLIEFKADQSLTVYALQKILFNPLIISRGLVSSIGVYNFPLFNYLLIFPSLISINPIFLSFFIAFLNSLLVVVFYFIVKKYYKISTALFASLSLSISPWGILFSRSIWAQDLILLFLIPCLYFIHQLIVDKNQKNILYLFILLALLIQIHSSGLFFAATTILIFIFLKIRLRLKKALLGFLLGSIPSIPYFFYQISGSPICPDCRNFAAYLNYPRSYDFLNFFRPFQLLNGLYFDFELGKDYSSFLSHFQIIKFLNILFTVESLVFFISLVLIYKYHRNFVFLIIYLFAMPLLYFITKTPSYIHYYVVLLPLIFIVLGIYFSILTRKIGFKACLLFFSIFLLGNIFFEICFYDFLGYKKNIDGDYGPIFSLTENKVDSETKDYLLAKYYSEIRTFSYVFANSKIFHQKLGQFFLQKNDFEFAFIEFQKALKENPNDEISRANTAYIFILSKDYLSAEKDILILGRKNPKLAQQLTKILKNQK